MIKRVVLALLLVSASAVPALAQSSGLAPADEYFGRYRLSVLGISNIIRDAGNRVHDSGPTPSMMTGPLAFANDAIHDWESKYPNDTWIPRALFDLQNVYASIGTPEALRASRKTVAWLLHDYPDSKYAAAASSALADSGDGSDAAPAEPQSAWERFAALRVPLPPH